MWEFAMRLSYKQSKILPDRRRTAEKLSVAD
jgi:hypothetical protein